MAKRTKNPLKQWWKTITAKSVQLSAKDYFFNRCLDKRPVNIKTTDTPWDVYRDYYIDSYDDRFKGVWYAVWEPTTEKEWSEDGMDYDVVYKHTRNEWLCENGVIYVVEKE